MSATTTGSRPRGTRRVTRVTLGRETGAMVDRGDHRIGDAERQQAIDLLRTHTGAGRLTLDEFADLAGQVFAAQTYRELEAVGRRLPPGLTPEPPAAQPPPQPGQAAAPQGRPAGPPSPPPDPVATTPKRRRRFVAVMSGSVARGRWHAPSEISAFAFWGGVDIDLREATIDGSVCDITAWAVMGGVTVTVPEGVRVELDGMVLMGGASDLTRTTEPLPGAPLVRVHARGMWGGVTLRTKRIRHRHVRSADTAKGEPTHAGLADPQPTEGGVHRPPSPLELPLRILDDVAEMLPRFVPPHGAPSPVRPPRPPGPGARSPRRARDRHPEHSADTTTTAQEVGNSTARRQPTPGAPPSGTLTMMVTDMVDSTALAERIGDRRWIDVLGDHNVLVREQVTRHGGTEIKAQGDGFLVVFSSARRAILAAVDVQRALAHYRDEHPEHPVEVRIGLHTGEIVDVDGDVFGQNVVVAARIADHAAPGEVVVSALTRDLTVSGGDLSFGPPQEVELKGLSQPWRVHRVSWTPEPA
jgi:class 3 adenylate cyclase